MTDRAMKFYPVMQCQCGCEYRARMIRDLACCPSCAIRQEEAALKEASFGNATSRQLIINEQAKAS